jgi:hypothetical protein
MLCVNMRRRSEMKGKIAIGLGVLFVALVAGSVALAYAVQTVGPNAAATRGNPWWTEGLTEQQIIEIREKMWNLRQQAVKEGWTNEQLMSAMHNLLAQYGIEANGAYFVDANGDGVCDNLGNWQGQMRHHQRQYQNCTFCGS